MADQIRTDTSPGAMVRAIEDNTLDYWRLMATSGVIWIEEADDLITVGAVEKPSTFRDSVLRTQFSDIDVEERIDTTLTGLGWPGAGLIWWQPPSSTPADMPERLLWRGFQRENDFPGLAIEIERLRPDEPRPGLEIEVVRDRERMVVASQTIAAGFETPEPIQRIFHEMYCGVGFDNPRFRVYLGLLDAQPAGTTILVTGGGVAGIYGVAVRLEARRRGVAGTLTTRAASRSAARR
jgi:ribosomal protein S18 acetylase RimI-like enzyme